MPLEKWEIFLPQRRHGNVCERINYVIISFLAWHISIIHGINRPYMSEWDLF